MLQTGDAMRHDFGQSAGLGREHGLAIIIRLIHHETERLPPSGRHDHRPAAPQGLALRFTADLAELTDVRVRAHAFANRRIKRTFTGNVKERGLRPKPGAQQIPGIQQGHNPLFRHQPAEEEIVAGVFHFGEAAHGIPGVPQGVDAVRCHAA